MVGGVEERRRMPRRVQVDILSFNLIKLIRQRISYSNIDIA